MKEEKKEEEIYDNYSKKLSNSGVLNYIKSAKDINKQLRKNKKLYYFIFLVLPSALIYYAYHNRNVELQEQNDQRIQESLLKNEQLQQRFKGFELIPAKDSSYVYLAGKGVHSKIQGQDLHVKIDTIKLILRESEDSISYKGLRINVYDQNSKPRKHLGSVSDSSIEGTLSIDDPEDNIASQVFVIKKLGSICKQLYCSVSLSTKLHNNMGYSNTYTDKAKLNIDI